jgi:hypothetical protein
MHQEGPHPPNPQDAHAKFVRERIEKQHLKTVAVVLPRNPDGSGHYAEQVKSNPGNKQQQLICTRSATCKCPQCKYWATKFKKQRKEARTSYCGDNGFSMQLNRPDGPPKAVKPEAQEILAQTFKPDDPNPDAERDACRRDNQDDQLHNEVAEMLGELETHSFERGGEPEPHDHRVKSGDPEASYQGYDSNDNSLVRLPQEIVESGGYRLVADGQHDEISAQEKIDRQNIKRYQGRPHGGNRAGAGRPSRTHLSRKRKEKPGVRAGQ